MLTTFTSYMNPCRLLQRQRVDGNTMLSLLERRLWVGINNCPAGAMRSWTPHLTACWSNTPALCNVRSEKESASKYFTGNLKSTARPPSLSVRTVTLCKHSFVWGDTKEMGRLRSAKISQGRQLPVLAEVLWWSTQLLQPHPEKDQFAPLLNTLMGLEGNHVNAATGGKMTAMSCIFWDISQRRFIRLLCFWREGFLLHPVIIIINTTMDAKNQTKWAIKNRFGSSKVLFPSSITLVLTKRN